MKTCKKCYKKYLCMMLGIFLVLTAFCGKKVSADVMQKIAYYDNSDFSDDIINEQFEISKTGNVYLEFEEKTYGLLSIGVSNSSGKLVFSKKYDFNFEERKFKISNLPAGTYTITISREDNMCDCYLSVYGVFPPDDKSPEFSISKTALNLDRGKSSYLKIKSVPSTSIYEVEWKSAHKEIASVNDKGLVKAKSVGTTKITAYVYCEGALYKKFTCKVKVVSGWNYKDFSKEMKAYAKKHKGLMYKDIDMGRICRLYSTPYYTYSTQHLKTQGFASSAYYEFYIELKKKSNNKLSLRLYCGNEITQYDIYDEVDLDVEALKMRSSNRMLSFDSDILSQNNYYSQEGYYYGKTKARALLSDADAIDMAKVKKFRTMLGQKSTYYKILCSDGAYYSATFAKSTRNTTIKIVNEYLKLVKNM